ncbi:MAG: dTDP-glucose 4,6-dehydratase [Dehalococcoidia bacterium]|nr:dTDP-glucose 4,6-dehydratase [Dehalococcoidia bacterium]MCA9829755.1 dTDP-glucose 4,6-dehydratase [Dehalococcoidia bacterium]MCB9484962.1 dTDP-glucose 4,6-dehydratase [Thermoflexaceae bacterium]
MKRLLVTGGAGFIGSNFVRYLREQRPLWHVTVLDKLTYAGREENLAGLESSKESFEFVRGDICDERVVAGCVRDGGADTIVHFAAESHVDQSIVNPYVFTETNVRGTQVLLEAARAAGIERFHYVGTDEVYGHVASPGRSSEDHAFAPRSPYAATKAAAEHLVHAYGATYGLPVTVTRGSNTIGPHQFPEKAASLFITNAIDGEPLPIYGDGLQVRDYMHVDDHCAAILAVLERGVVGEAYNVGTGVETANIEMARTVLEALGRPASLVRHVTDRAGHDRRYALDTSKLRSLGWKPQFAFDAAIAVTVRWYAEHEEWWRPIKSGAFRAWYEQQYRERLAGS